MKVPLILLSTIAAVLVSCTDDDGDGDTSPTASTASSAPLPSVVAEATSTAGGSGSAPETAPTASTAAAQLPPSTAQQEACPEEHGSIAAVDLASGDVEWTSCGARNETLRVSGASQGVVYAGSLAGAHEDVVELVAFDTATGSRRFEIPIPTVNESYHLDALYSPGPVAAGGVVVLSIAEEDESSVATVGYDALDGTELWRSTEVQGFVEGHLDDVVLVAEPSLLGFGEMPNPPQHRTIAALDRATGETRWEIDEPRWGAISILDDLVTLTLLRDDGRAFQGFSGIKAVAATSGETQWESEHLMGPVVRAGDALVGVAVEEDASGGFALSLRAGDAANGTPLWSRPFEPSPRPLGAPTPIVSTSAGPLAGDERAVYVLDGAALVALDPASGDELWTRELTASPIAATSAGLIVLTPDELQLLSPDDGSTRWATTTEDASRVTNVWVDEEQIYVSRTAAPGASPPPGGTIPVATPATGPIDVPATTAATLSPQTAKEQAETALVDGLRQRDPDVTAVCEVPADGEVGTTFPCTATVDGETSTFTATITGARTIQVEGSPPP